MALLVFASTDYRNIEIGIRYQKWAIAPPEDETFFKILCTKVFNVQPGSWGLFYCSEFQEFTTPFIVTTYAETNPNRVEVKNIWDDTWWFPFGIEPLGDTSKTIPAELARADWPFFPKLLSSWVSPSCVFNSIPIADEDWQRILRDLGA